MRSVCGRTVTQYCITTAKETFACPPGHNAAARPPSPDRNAARQAVQYGTSVHRNLAYLVR